MAQPIKKAATIKNRIGNIRPSTWIIQYLPEGKKGIKQASR